METNVSKLKDFSVRRRIDGFHSYLWIDTTSDVAQHVQSRTRKLINPNYFVKEKNHV